MLPHTRLLAETLRLTRALEADTNLFPIAVTITATASGVLEVDVKSGDDQHDLPNTALTVQYYVNKFSKTRAAENPDQTLRRRRPSGGGAIVQVSNPVAAIGELVKLLGGASLRGMPGRPSMRVLTRSDEELDELFNRLHEIG